MAKLPSEYLLSLKLCTCQCYILMGLDTFGRYCAIFSSHERSPGRAIALPPAWALALVSVSTFMLKFFKSLYFPDHMIDLVHIWYDDRYSSKVLCSNTPAHYLKVKVMDFEIFNVKDF